MSKRSTSFWFRLLCVLPLMVSLLLPAGLMPAVSGDGTITLVICTGHGPEERSFPVDGEEPEGAASWCPFSLASAPALAPAPIRWADIHVTEIVAFVPVARDVPTHSDVPTSRPRGPPFAL